MKQNEKKGAARHPEFAANCDMLFGLMPLAIMAVYLYGPRPAVMLALALVVAVCCDFLAAQMRGRAYDGSDNSSLYFAAAFVLLLPATASYTVVAVGAATAALLGKQLFGGAGCYPFHPTALAYAVVAVSWPDQVFFFPKPFADIGLWDLSGVAMAEPVIHTLRAGGVPNIPPLDLFLGNYAGPMGASFWLVILVVSFYLLLKRRISFELPLSFLASCALVSLCLPRMASANWLDLLKYDLLSGGLVFCAVFLLCEPCTAPKNRLARVLYGLLAGFLAMMFRYYGAYELGVCFALLLANAFSGWLDRLCVRLAAKRRAKQA